jgi:hemoglobin
MDFYERVLESERLAPWFEATDMRTLVDHQTKFVASLMGGPASYTDETLRRVHARLGITREAFEEMETLMRESLEDHGMADDDVADVMREIARCAPLIVSA